MKTTLIIIILNAICVIWGACSLLWDMRWRDGKGRIPGGAQFEIAWPADMQGYDKTTILRKFTDYHDHEVSVTVPHGTKIKWRIIP